MVAEALVVTARQGRVDRRRRLALPGLAEDLLEDADVQLVELVVLVAQLLGEVQVARAQQLGELAGHVDVDLAHLRESALETLRDGAVGEAHTGQLRDVLGDVAHPLERCADAQCRDDRAQVARDGLLPGEDIDRQLVELDRLVIDHGVVVDDLFGERDIARAERPRRLLDGLGDELGDLDEPDTDLVEGLLENLAHETGTFLG
ncbi:hypothetical protein GCM10009862_13170 [Microbacterium binotii]|uniref:Uncharacterized protein n=1 Tax=Microbacterium binotii TaxID=462710 RepID=A0ABN3P9T7_9MICO